METQEPYSLRAGDLSSDGYYLSVAAFTDAWLARQQDALGRLATAFQRYLAAQSPGASTRSFGEVALELLALGVLLREHGEQALLMAPIPAWVLARLVETQDRLPLAEKPFKAVRGLIRGLAHSEPVSGDSPDTLPFPGGAALLVGRLVDWLLAEGFTAQAERMTELRDYLAQLDDQRAQAVLARCLLLAEEFEVESEAALGAYTRQAERFARQIESCARWRYDGGLIAKSRVAYHLGMVGTEILSRAFRERFLAMPRKIVIVPDCLCIRTCRAAAPDGAPPAEKCQAERTDLGLRCQGCTPGCKVYQLTRLGEQRGFEVYILPDDFRGVGLSACRKLEGVGVVGVSCALTNWDAGWQVTGAGVPAQGVLLDYAGCSSHWDETGAVTDVNVRKVLEVLGLPAQRD